MKRHILKSSLTVVLLFFSLDTLAFPCFITMVKDNCWKNYNVTVDVLDAQTNEILVTLDIPKGVPWSRKSFESNPKQRFMLRARFSPAFWSGEENKYYYASRYWALPEEIVGETTAWHVGACFPENFSSVPLPPDAGSNCKCDRREIPDVEM